MAVRFIGDICYEQIKGNYWYANYHGFKVVMDKTNGYINATKLCADGGKSLYNWLENKRSQKTLNFYQTILNQPAPGIPGDAKISTTNMIPNTPAPGTKMIPNTPAPVIPGDEQASLNILPSITISGGDSRIRGTYL